MAEHFFFQAADPEVSVVKISGSAGLNEKNKWTEPVNLGSKINTEGDEMSPFIHFDGKTLYFASDGRVGMGGFDLFITRLKNDSTWTEPKNLGYPINTYNDEMGLIIESGGKKHIIHRIRDKSKGRIFFLLTFMNQPGLILFPT